MFELMDSYLQNAVIKVIGIGGGGSNAVEHMVQASIEGVDFISANTDAQALRGGFLARGAFHRHHHLFDFGQGPAKTRA